MELSQETLRPPTDYQQFLTLSALALMYLIAMASNQIVTASNLIVLASNPS